LQSSLHCVCEVSVHDPAPLRFGDSSPNEFRSASLAHKVSLIPLHFPANYVGGIVPLTLRTSLHLFSARVTIASGISETKIFASLEDILKEFTIPLRFASGIVRLTLQTSSRLVGICFQLGSLNILFTTSI